jgi:flavin-dependent dehydrogenase
MFDVVVIGAGPIGLYVARLCEKMGYKVIILEENKEIGKPLKCSGLISLNVKKFFPDVESWDVIENEVDSAVLHSKRSELVLKKAKAAYVINRVKFDKKISESVNCEIKLGYKAEKISVHDKSCEIGTSKGTVKGEMVIGCDGPNSLVAKDFAGRGKIVKGLIAIAKKSDRSKNVDLYFDKKTLKDGFFWKIPRGGTTEYGAWGSDVKFTDIEKFFDIKNYEKFAGLIPVKPVEKSYSRRILLIGGSAGQNKPWSGGGVVYGLTCANIAAKVIEKAFRFNDFSEHVLREYEVGWKGKIGKQIRLGVVFRKFLESSTDIQLDLAFRTGRLFNYRWMDMDFIV